MKNLRIGSRVKVKATGEVGRVADFDRNQTGVPVLIEMEGETKRRIYKPYAELEVVPAGLPQNPSSISVPSIER